MKTFKKKVVKKAYIAPLVQKVTIDNEISLVLTSIPQPVRRYDEDVEDQWYEDPY